MSRPAPPDMRDWGLVPAAELERIVVVSPHLDDAVLGCSYLMTAHPGVTVLTVFAGRPTEYPRPMQHWDTLCGFVEGDEVHEARRAEDRAALGLFDATPDWLGFVEHSYLERAEWVRAIRRRCARSKPSGTSVRSSPRRRPSSTGASRRPPRAGRRCRR